MPGLIRGVARTAVIAGTATAVSNRVSRRQAGRWAAKEDPQQAEYDDDQQQQQQPQQYPPQQYPPQQYPPQQYPPQQYPPQYAAPPAADPMQEKLDQLKQLGELKDQGVLSDEEFQQQKARILNS
jgi:hypothetical protein